MLWVLMHTHSTLLHKFIDHKTNQRVSFTFPAKKAKWDLRHIVRQLRVHFLHIPVKKLSLVGRNVFG